MKHITIYFLIVISLLLAACKDKAAAKKLDIPINQKIDGLMKDAAAATDENKKAALYGEASELLIDKGDMRQAMLAARNGERANPTQKQCLASIAEVQISEGKINEAGLTLKDLLQRHPQYGRAHFIQGNLNASRNDFAGAIKSYDLAEKHKFTDVRLLLNHGNVSLRMKKTRDAAKSYARAIAAYPDVAEGYLGAGIAAQAEKKKADAKKNFEKFLELAPHASQAQRVRLWMKNL
ncbi:MAG: tetratricopeptide repeat protein [Turneriella sp.]